MTKNNDLLKKVQYLSEFSDTEYPFISLYLNINASQFLEQVEQNRIYLKNFFQKTLLKLKNNDEKEKYNSFKNDQNKIYNYIENNLKTGAHGLAVFACDKEGVFEAYQAFMPFENEFQVDSFPHLKQLAYHINEYDNVLVAIVDSKMARLFSLNFKGFIINEYDVLNLVHRYHKQGGWSQMRYQRHIENQQDVHYKETAQKLVEIHDSGDYEKLILIGQTQETKHFEGFLPANLKEKIIASDHLELRENINEILETAINDLYIEEKEKEYKMVQDIIGRACSNDLSALGIQDTIMLAKQGQIKTLTLSKDLQLEGLKCGDRYYLARNEYKAGCPECNGNARPIDLISETIRLTFKNKGDVEIIEGKAAEELNKHEGIGAYLRY